MQDPIASSSSFPVDDGGVDIEFNFEKWIPDVKPDDLAIVPTSSDSASEFEEAISEPAPRSGSSDQVGSDFLYIYSTPPLFFYCVTLGLPE